MDETFTRGDATRERILGDAVRQASTVGLEGMSIGGLARAIGMSKSGVFAHFGSKEELQVAVVESARHSFIEAVFRPALSRPRGELRLRSLFDHWLDWTEGAVVPGGCPIIVASYEFDDRPGPVRDLVADVQRELVGALSRAVRLGGEEGHFRADVDDAQIAYELYGIILTFHLHHRLLGLADARERAGRAFEALVARCR